MIMSNDTYICKWIYIYIGVYVMTPINIALYAL